jgi:hypothetical protein
MRNAWVLTIPVVAVVLGFACGGTTNPTGNDGGPTLTCTGGSQPCGDTCVVTARDRENCGACGNACKDGELCSVGKCGFKCLGGSTQCGNVCTDLKVDPANCGGCGTTCKQNEWCSVGKCAFDCTGGTTKCGGGGDAGGGTCVSIDRDRFNCGGCGMTCDLGQDCVMGMCALQCQGGLTVCPTPEAGLYPADTGPDAALLGPEVCSNLLVDPLNCGGCGTVCSGLKPKCVSGACAQADAGN